MGQTEGVSICQRESGGQDEGQEAEEVENDVEGEPP